MATLEYLTNGGATVARKLVREILKRGYTVCIFDGEGMAIERSRNESAILAAMGTTELDTVSARDSTGERVGWFYLVYGNDSDGSELIADHSADDIALDIYDSLGLE